MNCSSGWWQEWCNHWDFHPDFQADEKDEARIPQEGNKWSCSNEAASIVETPGFPRGQEYESVSRKSAGHNWNHPKREAMSPPTRRVIGDGVSQSSVTHLSLLTPRILNTELQDLIFLLLDVIFTLAKFFFYSLLSSILVWKCLPYVIVSWNNLLLLQSFRICLVSQKRLWLEL